MIKKILDEIKVESDKLKEFRFIIFVAAYVLFSMVGAYNLAHLITFCYIILLLEQLVSKKD